VRVIIASARRMSRPTSSILLATSLSNCT